MNECSPSPRHRVELGRSVADVVTFGSATYLLTTALVVCATLLVAPSLIRPCVEAPNVDLTPLGRMLAWDGKWYAKIAVEGYSYHPREASSVAFFPVYPALAALLSEFTGLPAEPALLVLSHVSLLAAMIVFLAYARSRLGLLATDDLRGGDARPEAMRSREATFGLLALALFPTTFYFRFALTESLFVLLAILTLYGIQSGWPLGIVAAIIGLSTATKLVGVALVVPFAIEIWKRSARWPYAVKRISKLLPLALWGILAYMSYQAYAFKSPMAFVQTQQHWTQREPPSDPVAVFVNLITLEPVRAVYDRESRCYWATKPPREIASLNMMCANPVYFLLTVALLVLGTWKKWLNSNELVLGALLVGIPFVLQGHRICMAAQGRFTSVIFPTYLVIGHVLARLPNWLSIVLLTASGALMLTYAAMFTSWYWYY